MAMLPQVLHQPGELPLGAASNDVLFRFVRRRALVERVVGQVLEDVADVAQVVFLRAESRQALAVDECTERTRRCDHDVQPNVHFVATDQQRACETATHQACTRGHLLSGGRHGLRASRGM